MSLFGVALLLSMHLFAGFVLGIGNELENF